MHRIHCSLHKCLTVFYKRVFSSVYNRTLPLTSCYKHFNSSLPEFNRQLDSYRVKSINNHRIDFESLGDCRITRFVRDPRDLVVSGYFYHKRGAEEWSRLKNPTDRDWAIVNGTVPSGLKTGESFCDYLNRVDKQTGLIAEIEFRTRHFDAMGSWPLSDGRIKLMRYEDIVGNEARIISEIFDFYELSSLERHLGVRVARRAGRPNRRADAHVRDPSPGQWQQHFSSTVQNYFNSYYYGLLRMYGYN